MRLPAPLVERGFELLEAHANLLGARRQRRLVAGLVEAGDVVQHDRFGSNEIRVKRNDYGSVLRSTIGADGVARGQYDGGTRFALSCAGR